MSEHALTLLCHAIAIMRRPDISRPLSPTGIWQVERYRARLGDNKHDKVVSSPARRCVETAAMATGLWKFQIRKIRHLYPDPLSTAWFGDKIQAQHERLGRVPLCMFWEDSDPVMRDYAAATWPIVRKALDGSKNALLVGHSGLVSALAYIACNDAPALQAMLWDSNPASARGFRITFDDWKPIEVKFV